MPSTGCHKVGQFLPVTSGYGHDGCKYLVCTYGNEPWQDGYGNYKYYTEEQECSYGSFIPEYHSFDGYSNSNPCVGSGYEKYQCSKPGIFKDSQIKFLLNHGMTRDLHNLLLCKNFVMHLLFIVKLYLPFLRINQQFHVLIISAVYGYHPRNYNYQPSYGHNNQYGYNNQYRHNNNNQYGYNRYQTYQVPSYGETH